MNTTELIEIARECCSYPVKVSDYHWCGEGEFIFTEAGLNAFAQRIEAPHLQRIAELEQALRDTTEALRHCEDALHMRVNPPTLQNALKLLEGK